MIALVLSGIIHALRCGGRRADCAAVYGPKKTLCNRFVRWAERGIREGIFSALAGAGDPPDRLFIDSSCIKVHRCAGGDGADIVKAMLDPYNPRGYTDHVSFVTSKQNLCDARLSHVNYVVCDSDREGEFARVVEAHPATISYVKNQALGFEVPYRSVSTPRRHLPDFIVRLDDGRGPD